MKSPVHPILLATFFWLSPYALNRHELFLRDVLPPGLAVTAASIVLLGLFYLVLRRARAAGLLASLLIGFVAYYGYLSDGLNALLPDIFSNAWFMGLWTAGFVVLALTVLVRRPDAPNLTKVLNVGTITLVAIPLATLATQLFEQGPAGSVAARSNAAATANGLTAKGTQPSRGATKSYPNIYYLIFDRYGDERTLRQYFDYDNDEFLDFLREKGFFVSARGHANYNNTAYSLASSLNMQDLRNLSERYGRNASDWKPAFEMLRNNAVVHRLKQLGYLYLHMGSWWEPTRRNALADENFQPTGGWGEFGLDLNEFGYLIIEPTVVNRLSMLMSARLDYTFRRLQYRRVRQKFAKLANLPKYEQPLFVFAHMLLPHQPFVFNADGSYKSLERQKATLRPRNYVDQLLYTNSQIKQTVASILARDDNAIIILQSDEGPAPQRFVQTPVEWKDASVEELKQKFRILNAIYFPDQDYSALRHDLTPVNTFRIVFNTYLGGDLPLLPDRSYIYPTLTDIYTFRDVTDVLE